MSSRSKRRILVVDDEPSILGLMTTLLNGAGYEVSTAHDGFDALLQLRSVTPDIIISDLNMPQMSGFEFLSVVRRRFPDIPVVAASGAYEFIDSVPGGVIADAFYAKGQHHPEELSRTVADLIRTARDQAIRHHSQSAPVWIPRNGKDSKGVPLYRADLHRMSPVVPIKCHAGRDSGNPGNAVPLLRSPGQVHY